MSSSNTTTTKSSKQPTMSPSKTTTTPTTAVNDPFAAFKEQMRTAHEARVTSTSAYIQAQYGLGAALRYEMGEGLYRFAEIERCAIEEGAVDQSVAEQSISE